MMTPMKSWLHSRKAPGDSFTKVIRRNLHKPLETAGELLDHYKRLPPPHIDPEIAEKVLKERGRRSGGRK